MNSPISPRKNLRAIALGGTALALVLAGGVLGGDVQSRPPDPGSRRAGLQVQGVQIPTSPTWCRR